MTNLESLPGGLCRCGCGREVRLAPHNHARLGWIAGQPVSYVHGHNNGEPFDAKYHVETTGCWVWDRRRDRGGYGQHWSGGAPVGAHRISWERTYGPIPPGLCVLHHCDNPPCVNPDHLFLGTHADNARDRDSKGRGARLRGSEHPNARLQPADVQRIRDMLAQGRSQSAIAREYGVDHSTICLISTRKNWGWLT